MSNSLLPPTLDMQGLARLLHKSVRTIQRYLKDQPDALPPGKQIGDKWVWVTDAVLKWLSPPVPTQTQNSASLAQQLIKAGESAKEKK